MKLRICSPIVKPWSVIGSPQLEIKLRACMCEWSWRSSGCRRRNVLKEDLVGRTAPLLLWAGELLWARFQSCEWGCLPGGFGMLEEDAVRVSPHQFFTFLTLQCKWGNSFLYLGPWVFTPSNPSRWAPVMGPGRQESNGDAGFHVWEDWIFCLDPSIQCSVSPTTVTGSWSIILGVGLQCIEMEKSWVSLKAKQNRVV